MNSAPSVSRWLTSLKPLKKVIRLGSPQRERHPRKREGHVIIVGFGLNGRNLARVLKESDVPYVVLEANNDAVREMKRKGVPIYYGDGTSSEVLHQLSIETARLLVVAISIPPLRGRSSQLRGV